METLLPQVVPKEYESYTLDEISYQGAYVRCMTLIIVEGMIGNVLTAINCKQPEDVAKDASIQHILNALETSIIRFFEINKSL